MEVVWNENYIELHGKVQGIPQPSHMSHGAQYDMIQLEVGRLSGVTDVINVVIAHSLAEETTLLVGDELTVTGEVRSFNNRSGLGSRLVITVYARGIVHIKGQDENQLRVTGTLCKPPIYRKTPMGRDICDMMVAVNRKYGRTDYLPCITWGSLAQRCGGLEVGEKIKLEGRLQSRGYTKRQGEDSEERVAYEISVMQMELP